MNDLKIEPFRHQYLQLRFVALRPGDSLPGSAERQAPVDIETGAEEQLCAAAKTECQALLYEL